MVEEALPATPKVPTKEEEEGEETKFAPHTKEADLHQGEEDPCHPKARQLEALFDDHLLSLEETGNFQEELSKSWTPQAC